MWRGHQSGHDSSRSRRPRCRRRRSPASLAGNPPRKFSYISKAKPGRTDSIGLGLLAIWIAALQIILDKGQEDDWFSATWIRWTFALMIAGLIAFLVREFTAAQPIVKLSVFKNRNFAFGCLLLGLFGAVIYGVITNLPLFYQTVMGYTASASALPSALEASAPS